MRTIARDTSGPTEVARISSPSWSGTRKRPYLRKDITVTQPDWVCDRTSATFHAFHMSAADLDRPRCQTRLVSAGMGKMAGFRRHGDGRFSAPRPTEVWAVEYTNAGLERELAVMSSLNDAQGVDREPAPQQFRESRPVAQ